MQEEIFPMLWAMSTSPTVGIWGGFAAPEHVLVAFLRRIRQKNNQNVT
jgi:hypothetical protein